VEAHHRDLAHLNISPVTASQETYHMMTKSGKQSTKHRSYPVPNISESQSDNIEDLTLINSQQPQSITNNDRRQLKKQQNINQWIYHRTFHPNIPQGQKILATPNKPRHAREFFSDHLSPFGSPISEIDPTKMLTVCVQNTQHAFQIFGDGLEMIQIMDNLVKLGIQMLVPISPNVFWLIHLMTYGRSVSFKKVTLKYTSLQYPVI
jgi:hypothetical protein